MNNNRNAVIMGASMAGLLAARVASEFFDKVIIVERDKLPSGSENRRGVPQGKHTHGLLAGGRQALDGLFPGFSAEMAKSGAVCGDLIGDSRWFIEGDWHCQFPSGLEGMVVSRPMVEGVIRERVRNLPNVQFCEGEDVTGLLASTDHQRVEGVRLGSQTLSADLVVDATGRGSRSPDWMAAMGYPRVTEERVEIGLSYVTRLFRRSTGDANGNIAILVPSTPEGKRGGVMLAQEGNRWTVTLFTHFGQAVPTDLAGFVDFARSLPSPELFNILSKLEPIGEPAVLRMPFSLRRRYEKQTRFPEGYLVIGDAISSFNPCYGQGMTSASLQALELRTLFKRGHAKLAQRFFARAAKVVDIPWSIAVGNDLRMPEATGPRTLGVRLINAYMARLHKAAHVDPAVALAFHKVANLMAPPPSVMRPAIAWRVLRANLSSSKLATTKVRQLQPGRL